MKIRSLSITNFRSISGLTWLPGPGINVIVGPGDAGKTTVLDALALILSPNPSQAASELDYPNLDTSVPFVIEAVLGDLSDELLAACYPPPLHGWRAADRTLLPGPSDGDDGVESALVLRASGNSDLELRHELVQPGAATRPLTVAQRNAMGLWNVMAGRGTQSQLRMSGGSLLERALGRDVMRAPAAAALRGARGGLQVPEEGRIRLASVETRLKAAGLDIGKLDLAITPSGGQTPVQLLNLIVLTEGGYVPLSSFGRGTQQMAMVALATAQASVTPMAVLDELEMGLEPYRQRELIRSLRDTLTSDGQAFITTHSSTVLSLLLEGEAWRINTIRQSIELKPVAGQLHKMLAEDAEALLSRLPVVCEGITEVGFAHAMLSHSDDGTVRLYDSLGVHLVDGRGHEPSLELIQAFHGFGVPVAGLLDDEPFRSGTRQEVAATEGVNLCILPGGQCTEAAVSAAVPVEHLDALLGLAGRDGHADTEARIKSITTRLGAQQVCDVRTAIENHGEQETRTAVGLCAHRGSWFKSRAAGAALADFVYQFVPADHPLRVAMSSFAAAVFAQVTSPDDAVRE